MKKHLLFILVNALGLSDMFIPNGTLTLVGHLEVIWSAADIAQLKELARSQSKKVL